MMFFNMIKRLVELEPANYISKLIIDSVFSPVIFIFLSNGLLYQRNRLVFGNKTFIRLRDPPSPNTLFVTL